MQYSNREKFEELADRLQIRGEAEATDIYDLIIARCRSLAYDDFANEEFATPKIQMVNDLREAGLRDEAIKVINGEYDQ